MKGGTTFHFVDAEPTEALALARELADGGDVRIGGGVATVRQFLAADLIDHLYLVVVPIVLGRGERLWDGLEGIEERFTIEPSPRHRASRQPLSRTFRRRSPSNTNPLPNWGT